MSDRPSRIVPTAPSLRSSSPPRPRTRPPSLRLPRRCGERPARVGAGCPCCCVLCRCHAHLQAADCARFIAALEVRVRSREKTPHKYTHTHSACLAPTCRLQVDAAKKARVPLCSRLGVSLQQPLACRLVQDADLGHVNKELLAARAQITLLEVRRDRRGYPGQEYRFRVGLSQTRQHTRVSPLLRPFQGESVLAQDKLRAAHGHIESLQV